MPKVGIEYKWVSPCARRTVVRFMSEDKLQIKQRRGEQENTQISRRHVRFIAQMPSRSNKPKWASHMCVFSCSSLRCFICSLRTGFRWYQGTVWYVQLEYPIYYRSLAACCRDLDITVCLFLSLVLGHSSRAVVKRQWCVRAIHLNQQGCQGRTAVED